MPLRAFDAGQFQNRRPFPWENLSGVVTAEGFRQLFGGFPIVGDPHDQGEHEAMRPLVQRMQRTLIARGDALDEPDPVLLGYGSLRRVDMQQVAEESRRITLVLAWRGWRTHDAQSCRHP